MPERYGLKSCTLWLSLAFSLFFSLTFPRALDAQESWKQLSDYSSPTCMADGGEYLWIGTPGGLVRLRKATGEKTFFTMFNSSLTDTRILSLAMDGTGTLWVGTEAGGLSAFDGKTWTRFDSTNSPLRKPGVALLARDTGTGVWILARGADFGDSIPQLLHKRGNDWKAVALPAATGNLAGSTKWAGMGTDASGRLWIESTKGYYGTSHRALLRVDGSGNVSTLPPPSDDAHYSLVTENGDVLWIHYRFIVRESGSRRDTLAIPDPLLAWITDGTLQNLHWRSTDGSEFLALGGLMRLKDGRWETASVPAALKSYDRGIRIAGDGSGGAWFAYSDGSLRHLQPGGRILLDTLASPLPSTFISSLVPTTKSAHADAWVNTGNQMFGLSLEKDRALPLASSQSHPRIAGRSMTEDAEGGVWFDTELGPMRMGRDGAWSGPSGERARLFPPPGSLRSFHCRSLFALDKAGTLWIADNEGLAGLPADPDAAGERYDHPYLGARVANPYDGSVHGLAICGDGDRWISGYSSFVEGRSGNFLSRLSGGNWTHFDSTDHPWLGSQTRKLACDGAGRLWIAMSEGLLQWDGKTWKSFAAFRSNPYAYVSLSMAVDPQGRLWVGGHTIDAPLRTFSDEGWIVDAEAAVKLRNVSISSMEFDATGRLWLGTDSHGLLVRGASQTAEGLFRAARPRSGSGRLSLAKAGAGSWLISVEGLPPSDPGTRIRASIHDFRGRLVWRGGDGTRAASPSIWNWDGKDRHGMPLSPGRYFLSAASASGTIGSLAFMHPGR